MDELIVFEGDTALLNPDVSIKLAEFERMVENIKEELDAPGEWFYDRRERRLYYYPGSDIDMNKVSIEVVRLGNLIEVQGERANPVVGIRFQGLVFRHSNRTFMENKEQYKQLLERAKMELKSFRAKYAMLTELEAVFDVIDRV